MPKSEVSNKELYEALEDIKKVMNKQLLVLKLANKEKIESAQTEILKVPVRKKIFDLCVNKKSVTQIANDTFTGEPTEKSQPKTSYHLAILEDNLLVDHRDENGQRYYFKIKESS